jgi:hypothetical protein
MRKSASLAAQAWVVFGPLMRADTANPAQGSSESHCCFGRSLPIQSPWEASLPVTVWRSASASAQCRKPPPGDAAGRSPFHVALRCSVPANYSPLTLTPQLLLHPAYIHCRTPPAPSALLLPSYLQPRHSLAYHHIFRPWTRLGPFILLWREAPPICVHCPTVQP